MRLAFVLLLVTNIAVLVWQLTLHEPVREPPRPPAGGDLEQVSR